MIKVGIVGATGYVGGELTRILLSHPQAEIVSIAGRSHTGKNLGEVFENFRHSDLVCGEENMEEMAKRCDVIFLALPHGVASVIINESILSQAKVIDLGADFRLADVGTYEKHYGVEHFAKEILPEAVYGLCEIHREEIKKARIIANPGCYTTCSILALYPLLKEGLLKEDSVIVDAKSGVSGAGRGLDQSIHYNETNENFKAYKVASHRHRPEIEEQLSLAGEQDIRITFTPHLVPMNRGIFATCYGSLKEKYSYEDIKTIYEKYYGEEYFIRLTKKGFYPETKWVKASNFCDIGFAVDSHTGRIIVAAALDNLVKGAAGQAVQNMNLLFGLEERTGLTSVPIFPA